MQEVSGHGQGSLRMRTEGGTSALTLSSRWQESLSVSCPLLCRRVLSFFSSFFSFVVSLYVCSNFGYVVFVVSFVFLLADFSQLAQWVGLSWGPGVHTPCSSRVMDQGRPGKKGGLPW